MRTPLHLIGAGLAASLALGLAALAGAGEPKPAPRPGVAEAPQGVAPASSRTQVAKPAPLRRPPRAARDPFGPPPALRGRALPAGTARRAGPAARDPLAGLEIRALLVLRGGRSGAVLALGGRRWLVRPGDRFPVGGLSAEVRKVDRRGLELQLRDGAGHPFGPARRVSQ